jgi:hypothetical protein
LQDPHGSGGDKEIDTFAVSSRPFSHHTGMIYPALRVKTFPVALIVLTGVGMA